MPSMKHHKGKSSWVFLICFYCCFITGGCLQQGVAKRGLKEPTHAELWRPTRAMHPAGHTCDACKFCPTRCAAPAPFHERDK